MEKVETKFSQPRVRDDLAVLGSFLVFGGISGLLFAGLTNRGSLQDFFYFKGDKFLIPRYSYWIAFSLVQLIGLATPYLLSYSRGWLFRRVPSARLLLVAIIIGSAAPLLRLLARPMNTVFGPAWDIGIAPLTFLILLSFALCIMTADARRLPLAIVWIILFVVVDWH